MTSPPVHLNIHDATPAQYATLAVSETVSTCEPACAWKWLSVGSVRITVFRPLELP